MVSQKKIAELAGVSRGTVDRVLNNRSDVSPEVQERVMQIANALKYKPNRAAKSLVLQQKNLKIGCILGEEENPFYIQLIEGIEQKAKELEPYGVQVVIHRATYINSNANRFVEKIDELLDANINGLIIQPFMDSFVIDKLKLIAESQIPIVALNTNESGFEHCYVGNDFYVCGKTAANLLDLITGGICKVGIITGFLNTSSHADRVRGIIDYIDEKPNMEIVSTIENQDDDFISFSKTETMLRNHSDIDALIITAGGVYGACRALKMTPDYNRIRVVSFDDVPTTKALIKDGTILGTICQQPVRQGALALEALFDYFIDPSKFIERKIYTDIQIKLKANIDM